ncbi:hypothetical protein [Haloprofundus halobius]|uniref:hypothetical protein n=1 Tax=Haloprofundus halobius TaxID=2876194 RepID=UPI001CCE8789|nr:hypothetical protein [Haloprofundus halobius]
MSADETEIRSDRENDRVIVGDVAVTLRGEDGVKIPIDHASPADGYVAFTGGYLHLQFQEVDNG